LNKIVSNFIAKLPQLEETLVIEKIISKIENFKWNEARLIWYTKIMKKDLSKVSNVDFYGEVEEYFLNIYTYIKLTVSFKIARTTVFIMVI
jgi:hypothetical protein